MKIVVASNNPVKIEAVRRGVQAMLGGDELVCEGVTIDSGVSDQPMSDRETFLGARQRSLRARQERPSADFWAGIEGGVEETPDGMIGFAWVVVLSKTQIGQARTATFQVPPEIAALMRQGIEMGAADDLVFQRTNSKRQDGAVGILTGGVIDRTVYYAHAVTLALIPFKNSTLFTEG